MMTSMPWYLLLTFLSPVVWGLEEEILEECAKIIPCVERSPGCSSCTAPASFSSGISCKRPHGFMKFLRDPWCFYCEATNQCMDHNKASKSACAKASAGFVKFEEQCMEVSSPEDDDYTPNEFLANWMGKVIEVGNPEKTLLDLSLFGSHDSFSYDLSLKVGELESGMMDMIAHDIIGIGHKIIPGFEDKSEAFVRRAAISQFLNISQQLDSGVRFIDLRIGCEDDVWYSQHTLRSNSPVRKYLNEIKDWMTKHPMEVVVIWISRHGVNEATGDDQFPGVSLEQKKKFWSQYTSTFDGMLVDFTNSPIHSTPLKNIAGKIVTYATDYVELTDSSPFALDSPQFLINEFFGYGIGGRVNGTSAVTASYLAEQEEFEQAKANKKKNPDQFFLLSMASPMKKDVIKAASAIALNPMPSSKDKGQRICDDAYKIPGFGGWCPMTLLDVSLLTNYYKQVTLEQARLEYAWDFPHAIYIDAVDFDGTIRTSGELPWERGQSYDPEEIKRYGAAWAIISRNLHVMCDDVTDEKKKSQCNELMHTAEMGIQQHPAKRWDHPLKGRLSKWPESHSAESDTFMEKAPASFSSNTPNTATN
uniref:Phosphatidylinositol-specific phospholipase C X domain-containing protein n=1 Tax=Ditylum brightwellii TaxID=49249 RepID=A0A7S4UGV8_9STRA